MAQARMVRGSNHVFEKEEERNALVENMVRIMLLEPKASVISPVAVRKGVYEGQISVFYQWKDSKELSDKVLGAFASAIGAYMVTKFIQRGVVHFCIEWSTETSLSY